MTPPTPAARSHIRVEDDSFGAVSERCCHNDAIAVNGDGGIAAVSVCDLIILGFIAPAGGLAFAVWLPRPRTLAGSPEVTPHQQVKQHKVYDRPRKKWV